MQLTLRRGDDPKLEMNINEDVVTLGEFRRMIADVMDYDFESVCIKIGYPPEKLVLPDHVLLRNTPIVKGVPVGAAGTPKVTSPPEMACAGGSSSDEPPPATCLYRCKNAGSDHLPEIKPLPNMFHTQQHTHPSRLAAGSVPSVKAGDGYLVERKVPGDNSCLFRCLLTCLGHADMTMERLRGLVRDAIQADPITYNEAVLESSVDDYCRWIMEPSSWGGGIEMAILSARFHVEICSVDIHRLRVDRFGEGRYVRRIILLYSGSHYNYAALASDPSNPVEFDQTLFEIGHGADSDGTLLTKAIELARLVSSPYSRFI
ncbi:ubiquitin-specific protease otu1 [Coemansia sp. Benny D115]|nr:ubiquitin-specific protease otu1 [Coemansia sp. Benny D115]